MRDLIHQRLRLCFGIGLLLFVFVLDSAADQQNVSLRPNILIAISDDQSFPHASAYGCPFVETPGFDEVAKSGVLFRNAYSATPGCSPSRASLLTGLHAWQLEHAGTHASSFPAKFAVFPDTLEKAGYQVGFTGKGWGPGNWRVSGRDRNPCGPAFQQAKLDESPAGISKNDYATNFEMFLEQRDEGQPFCFWYGAHEPHRGFGNGRGKELGKSTDQVNVPAFLPDDELIRSDLLDYGAEIEWFDQHLVRMIEHLESIGERENTLIIVTSDNGMAFPRAKANLYEFGIHVPLAVSWPASIPMGQTLDELVGFVDITATILTAARITPGEDGQGLSGRSFLAQVIATGQHDETERRVVFASRERHSSSRYHSLGYPQRAMRSDRWLLIHNPRPERWPAGAPQKYGRGGYPTPGEVVSASLGQPDSAYHDIDACPTLTWMLQHRDDEQVGRILELAVGHRPEYELFDVIADPGCLRDFAAESDHRDVLRSLQVILRGEQLRTNDPRAIGDDEVFETFARYSNLRFFPEPDWVHSMPERVPEMPWWTKRYRETLDRAVDR